jgi:oligoendopeptidase F
MTTEVASTVNDILLADYRIKNEQDKTKKAELLYSLIENIRITYFRQTMFAEFEEIVHRKIEDGESLSAEDFNSIYYKLNEKYFGKDVIIDDNIKYEWSRIPHFYSDFYVYKYATGISAAISIATRIIDEEPGFTDKYIGMLKQGRSKNSIELLSLALNQ